MGRRTRRGRRQEGEAREEREREGEAVEGGRSPLAYLRSYPRRRSQAGARGRISFRPPLLLRDGPDARAGRTPLRSPRLLRALSPVTGGKWARARDRQTSGRRVNRPPTREPEGVLGRPGRFHPFRGLPPRLPRLLDPLGRRPGEPAASLLRRPSPVDPSTGETQGRSCRDLPDWTPGCDPPSRNWKGLAK